MSKYKKRDNSEFVVEAVQFDPHKQPWPDGVMTWAAEKARPRDMSWGYIETITGREHVQTEDYIVTIPSKEKCLVRSKDFEKIYEPLEPAVQPSKQKPKTTRDSLVHWIDSDDNEFVGVLVDNRITRTGVLSDIYVFPTRNTEGKLLLDAIYSEEHKPLTWHWIERIQWHDWCA